MAENTQAYGITLPITHGPQGYFNQSYNAVDQVKSNLNLLLRTRKGERRLNPEFGSGLWSLLFENIGEDIAFVIKSAIQKDINRWMSYVKIQSIDVTNTAENSYNKIQVSVIFTVPSIGVTSPQTLDVTMNTTNI
jgi:hypothetical protein